MKEYKEDGIIWGASVFYDIFQSNNYTVTASAIPMLRLPVTLAGGEIDAFMYPPGLEEYEVKFLRSDLPLTIVKFFIYFDKRKSWRPTWPPDDEFRAKEGKSQDAALALNKFLKLNVSRSSSREANIKMVNLGRVDYWIDHDGGFARAPLGSRKNEAEGFATEFLFEIGVYAWFLDSDKGRQLLAVFNKGHKALLATGQYAKVYYQQDPLYTDISQVESTIKFIASEHPKFDFPPQEKPAQ